MIDEYLKILADEEVKDFLAIDVIESINEEQNVRKVPKLPYFFSQHLVKYYQILLIIIYVTIMLNLNLFDPELQLINTKSVIKNRFKRLLSKLKIVLVLGYKKNVIVKSFVRVLN